MIGFLKKAVKPLTVNQLIFLTVAYLVGMSVMCFFVKDVWTLLPGPIAFVALNIWVILTKKKKG